MIRNKSNIKRLNSDESIYNRFNPGTNAVGRINIILPLETGKIFVGGGFVNFDGQPSHNLAQLAANGKLEPVRFNVNAEVFNPV